ncbi:MAG TPA: TPM domain-containing protein [Pyrinomonadaceae bacterium]
MKRKLSAALAPAAACLALAAAAAGCGLVSSTDKQADGAAARQSSLAPDASTPSPQTAPPTSAASPAPNASPAKVEGPLSAPVGFVNDYAKVIDYETRQQLEEKLSRLKERSHIEFAVATVETTGGQSIFDYSLAVARGWHIGSKETGDGLLLLLAVKDRKWHIQITRSLEPVLTKDELSEVGMSAHALYRDGKHGEGIVKCVDGLIVKLAEKKRFKMD